jgi:hypothetical protein
MKAEGEGKFEVSRVNARPVPCAKETGSARNATFF